MANGENKKKLVLLPILRFLTSLIVFIAAYAAGAFLKGALPNASVWRLVVIGCIIVLIAGSCLAQWILKRKLNKRKVAEGVAIVEEHRLRVTADPMAAKKRLSAACAAAVTYCVLLGALSLLLAFLEGAAGKPGNIGSLLSLYLLYGFAARILVKREKPDYSKARKEEEFPELYALAKEAAAEMAISGRIHIFTYFSLDGNACNASVSAEKGDICLYLSVTLLGVLNREEMKQILLHEFAHLEGSHDADDRSYYKLMEFLCGEEEGVLGFWTGLALRFCASLLSLEGLFYMQFSSRYKETLADAAASSAGCRETQASALAKTNAYTYHTYELEPYLNFYRSEAVPQRFASDIIDAFRTALVENGDRWRGMLESEIPPRASSHPIFRQRWEALGMCAYSLEPSETQSPYAQECRKAAELVDKSFAEEAESYSKARAAYYLESLETVAAFESNSEGYTPDTLRPVIDAYYGLGMPGKAEAVCDHILKTYDSPFATAYAAYRKGMLLLRRYDASGIDLVYTAMECNTNYIDEGLQTIGSFCCMMGLEKELTEYRDRAVELLQREADHSGGGIDNKADLSQETLPEGWQEQILAYILKVADGCVTQVYLVHEQLSKDFGRSAFILRFPEGTQEEAMDDVYYKVFALLDDWPVNWEFSLYTYESTMEKALSRVEGSCIYGEKK